ncbi:Uncharacterised protein [Vibrio cholerae]|nr:Uncharacterised protein [Vibrio cholerae]CSC54862.1 Uncharacterised protein [Vibrio cholerae]CSC82891.1 Uncharacterised protein [Vibrio cholerae]CSD21181.1 Uncharacterised protein [Vibrio cholerae]CSI62864.1 Uncharacterised protein [Vibrio cholerae]
MVQGVGIDDLLLVKSWVSIINCNNWRRMCFQYIVIIVFKFIYILVQNSL